VHSDLFCEKRHEEHQMTRLHPTTANRPCSTAFAPQALLGLATLLFILAAAGCSKGSNTQTASGGAAASTSENGDDSASASGADPCALLDVSEVEAALGKLAGPPYRVGQNGPEAGGSSCMYEAASGRTIKLSAMWGAAAPVFKMLATPAAMAEGAGMKGKLPLPDGATFEGDWDEAKTVGCCLLYAMLGDQMVDLDFAATHLDMKQAATLVNASLKRLNKSLSIDGDSGVDRLEIAGHVAECQNCRCELEELQRTTFLVRDANVFDLLNAQEDERDRRNGQSDVAALQQRLRAETERAQEFFGELMRLPIEAPKTAK